MSDFFSKAFYGNTIGEWLIAFSIIASGIILGKIFYWVIGRFIKAATKKTKSKLDDILVDMFEEPISLSIFILSFWYGLGTLNLSVGIDTFFGHVTYIIIVFDIAWLIVRMFDAMVQEYLVPRISKSESNLDDQLLPIVSKTIKATVWTVALVVGLNNAGYDIGALIAGLGIGGLALAMAAKDSVANLFGGLTVFLDKPFEINDRVMVDGYDGIIEEIGIRSTRLRTLAGRRVTIPNSHFTSKSIENISSEPNRKVAINLGLTYDTAPENIQQSLDLLKEITSKYDNVLEEKKVIGFTGFGDFSLNLLLIYYVKSGEDVMATNTSINLDILKTFNENKLEFAFPTQTIMTQQN